MFWLEPRQELAHPQRGSPRMFRVDWIERYLSRVHPWHVVAVWVPVLGWFLAAALRDPALSTARAALGVLAGLAFWTLLEYVLHRWVFHFTPNPDSEFSQDIHFLIHGVHHDWPHDPDRLVMPPVMSIFLAIVLTLFARFILLTIFTELSTQTVNLITVGVFVYLTALTAWIIYKAGTIREG